MDILLMIIGAGIIIFGLYKMTKSSFNRVTKEGRPVSIPDLVLIAFGIILFISGISLNYLKKNHEVKETEMEINPEQGEFSTDSSDIN